MTIQEMLQTPIDFSYVKPNATMIAELKNASQVCIIEKSKAVMDVNAYYQWKYPGTFPQIFTRQAVYDRLQQMIDFLSPHYGLYIFDAFRTRATQGFLFTQFQEEIKAKHPEMSLAEIEIETRKYVSHPDEPARFAVPPHNSGGAIDIALFDLSSKQLLEFGAEIDRADEISSTDFFEAPFDPAHGLTENAWMAARRHRRLLFHTMRHFGFTNFPTEWWHYDLGDCMWALALNVDFIFDSMEAEVNQYLQTI